MSFGIQESDQKSVACVASIEVNVDSLNRLCSVIKDTETKKDVEEALKLIVPIINEINKMLDEEEQDIFFNSVRSSIEQLKAHLLQLNKIREHTAQRSDQATIKSIINLIEGACEATENQLPAADAIVKDAIPEWMGQALYYEKQLLKHNNFATTLEQLKKAVEEQKSDQPNPTVYICWSGSADEPKWVSEFIDSIHDYLEATGVNVYSLSKIHVGGNQVNFIEQIKSMTAVLLFGTPELLNIHNKPAASDALHSEISNIFEKLARDVQLYGESSIFPLLLRGSKQTSFPSKIRGYQKIKELPGESYVKVLQEILGLVFSSVKMKAEIKKVFDDFLNKHSQFVTPMDERIVGQMQAEEAAQERAKQEAAQAGYSTAMASFFSSSLKITQPTQSAVSATNETPAAASVCRAIKLS
jgi:hypothetical protein